MNSRAFPSLNISFLLLFLTLVSIRAFCLSSAPFVQGKFVSVFCHPFFHLNSSFPLRSLRLRG